jgi:hypothetical protein
MDLHPMPSSSIAAAGYDARAAVLRIRFMGGGTYDYLGVPEELYAALEEADSKGRFVNGVIKPRFPYRRVAS